MSKKKVDTRDLRELANRMEATTLERQLFFAELADARKVRAAANEIEEIRTLMNGSLRRHPRWLRGWQVREGAPVVFLNGYRVTAVDASGAEFGFYIGGAGWPEMAEQLANELAHLLNSGQR